MGLVKQVTPSSTSRHGVLESGRYWIFEANINIWEQQKSINILTRTNFGRLFCFQLENTLKSTSVSTERLFTALCCSCHLAESRVWCRGDSTAGLREALSSIYLSLFYHPALSVLFPTAKLFIINSIPHLSSSFSEFYASICNQVLQIFHRVTLEFIQQSRQH